MDKVDLVVGADNEVNLFLVTVDKIDLVVGSVEEEVNLVPASALL